MLQISRQFYLKIHADVLMAVGFACSAIDARAADWEINEPQQNEAYFWTSDVAGSGTSNHSSVSFVAKVKSGSLTLQSKACTTSPIGNWVETLVAPSGGWLDGSAKFQIWYDNEEKASQNISFASPEDGPA